MAITLLDVARLWTQAQLAEPDHVERIAAMLNKTRAAQVADLRAFRDKLVQEREARIAALQDTTATRTALSAEVTELRAV